jgi:hypothetical protein
LLATTAIRIFFGKQKEKQKKCDFCTNANAGGVKYETKTNGMEERRKKKKANAVTRSYSNLSPKEARLRDRKPKQRDKRVPRVCMKTKSRIYIICTGTK